MMARTHRGVVRRRAALRFVALTGTNLVPDIVQRTYGAWSSRKGMRRRFAMSITPLPAPEPGQCPIVATDRELLQLPLPVPVPALSGESEVPAGPVSGDGASWSLAQMLRVCEHKGIRYGETSAFVTRRSVVASSGDVVILKVRKELDEPSKVAAVAHEFGHIALGHTAMCCAAMWDARTGQERVVKSMYLQARERVPAGAVLANGMLARGVGERGSLPNDPDEQETRRAAEEREANIWAAHLLVRGEVFNAFLNELRAEGIDAESASKVAAVRTANRLNIPQEMVECWVYNYEWQFSEPPLRWLERSGR